MVFLLGATNSGKSTLIRKVTEDPDRFFSVVEVGRKLREKYLNPESKYYDPNYFSGQQAPTHTESEAYGLMMQGIGDAKFFGSRGVLIDGQPRSESQARRVLKDFRGWPKLFVHLHAPAHVRRARALARDSGDPVALALALTRVEGDLPAVSEVLGILHDAGETVLSIGTYPDDLQKPQRVLDALKSYCRNPV
jgi:hypothetical protein